MYHTVSKCRVNYIEDREDNSLAPVSQFYYQLNDEDNNPYPVPLSPHAYGLLVKEMKSLSSNKEKSKNINKHIKIGDKSIKVIDIIFTGEDKDFDNLNDDFYTITMFNENLNRVVKLPLANKYRLSHPTRISICRNYSNKNKTSVKRTTSTKPKVSIKNFGTSMFGHEESEKTMKNIEHSEGVEKTHIENNCDNFISNLRNKVDEIEEQIQTYEELKAKMPTFERRKSMLNEMIKEFS